MSEQVILVDHQDQAVGVAEKLKAHQKGWLHRAFSVFVFNDQGALLLQQRHPEKYHAGGLWTNTCCSHPRPGEATKAAAQRRLYEELGFCVDLQKAGHFTYRAIFDNGLIEHEYDHVFCGQYQGERIVLNHTEVADTRWLSVSAVWQAVSEHPEQFTPWFSEALGVVSCSLVESSRH